MTRPARTTRRKSSTPEGVAPYRPGDVICSLRFAGRAVPWKAPTVTRRKGTFKDRGLVSWQREVNVLVRAAMVGRRPATGPVYLGIEVDRKAPRGKRPGDPWVTRPDADNLAKGISDSINGVVFLDDAQVSHLSVTKRYGPRDEVSIVAISLSPEGAPPCSP